MNPVVDARYPLSRINEALKHIGEGHAGGKVVIRMEEGDLDG